nr:hypothetical protein [Tanacetum cinerariifolium]
MESRYKHKNLTKLDSDVTKNGPPAKLLWYLPIIPRLKKLYANPKDAKFLCWHAKERKSDGTMRYFADSPQWKTIDRLKQLGNDIDVYLRPLIDDMIDLWETDVDIYDAYKKEMFQLFAMIYCTINDFPAYGNLSGNDLAPQVTNGTKMYLPPACYTLSKAEKTSFCECLHGVKVPSGYSANIKNLVSMKDLKFLEGSIVQRYVAEEVVRFCTNYMDDVANIGLPQPRHQGRLDEVEAIRRKDVMSTNDDFEQACFTVFQNMTCIEPYIHEHMSYLAENNSHRDQRWLEAEHKRTFSQWLADKVIRMSPTNVDADAHFRLENNDVKKRTLVSCGTKWKAFKTKLRVKFMLKKVSPLQKWTFIERNWQEEKNDSDKATKLYLILDICGSNYCLARAPRDKNRIKTLPPKLTDGSKNLVQATRELAQGSNESKAGVDPLILVLGLEHGGRMRGVGCDIGAELKAELRNEMQAEQNLFSPREDDVPNLVHMKSSLNSTTIMQGEHNESISTRQVDVSSSVQMRSNLSSTTSIIREEHQGQQNESISTRQVDVPGLVHRRSNLSSTISIVKLHFLKEETYCCLYIPSSILAGEKVVCSTATVYPIRDGILHFKNLLKGHMKVLVIKVVEIHKSMKLPVPDDEIPNLESAVKVFIQWPIAIACFTGMYKPPVSGVPTERVMPQHENTPYTKKGKGNETPNEPNKQDKALEETTKHQKMMQKIDEVKERKAANRKSLQALEDEVLLNRPQSVINGYNKWMSHGDYAEPYAISVNKK